QIISGTHAISLALLALLGTGDELIYISGEPYDTLEKVIGTRAEDIGSLMEKGVRYRAIDLVDDSFDEEEIMESISDRTKMIAIQRSRGYSMRKSLTIGEIETMIAKIKERYPEIIIFVDNCYGEFVERREPIEAGADIIAGSLIKNPGGGIAKMGGYIAGGKALIECDLRGYSMRKSLTIGEIETMIAKIKERYPEIIIFVDNCYGEFVERRQPIEAGADIIAGSLIKNPGGGIAKMGGYIAGRKDLIE